MAHEEALIVKEGWVQKSDPNGKRWRQRWAVLTTEAFAYYTKPDKEDIRGVFPVSECSFTAGWTLHDRKAPTPHVFSVHTPGRVYYVSVANDEQVFRWGRAFEEVRHANLAQLGTHGRLEGDDTLASEAVWESKAPGGAEEGAGDAAPAARAPPPPPPARGADGKAVLYVTHRGGGAGGTDSRVTLRLPAAKLPSTRVGSLKKALARKTGVAPEEVTLYRDAASAEAGVPLAHSATCGEAGIVHEGPPLVMHLLQSAAGAAAGLSTSLAAAPSPPPARAPGPVPVAARVARRLVLQRVFSALPGASGPGGALSGLVKRADLAHAMEGDAELAAWSGTAGAFQKLAHPPPGRTLPGGAALDPDRVSWAEVCDVLHEEAAAISAPSDAAAVAGVDTAPAAPLQLAPAPAPPTPAERAAAVATGEGALGVSLAALEASLAPPQEHVYGEKRVVLTVDVAEGASAEVAVGVGDDAEGVARAFLARHAPSAGGDTFDALLTEVLHSLAEVHAAEGAGLREALKQSNEHLLLAQCSLLAVLRATRALTAAADAAGVTLPAASVLASLPEGAGMAASAALAERVATQLLTGGAPPASTAPSPAPSPPAASAAPSAAPSPSASEGALTEALRHELAASRVQVRELEFRLTAATEEAAAAREGARAAYHDTGADAAVLTRQEWRAWAKEKRELIAAANADRAALTEELHRLRDALRLAPGAEGTEAKLRALDEDRARLGAANAKLQAHADALQGELSDAYAKWNSEQGTWATERARLTQQLADVADVAASGGVPAAAPPSEAIVPASRAELQAAGEELAGVQAAHRSALKNWAEETEVLTQLWKSEKAAWEGEKAALVRQIAAQQATLTGAATPSGAAGRVPEVSPMGRLGFASTGGSLR